MQETNRQEAERASAAQEQEQTAREQTDQPANREQEGDPASLTRALNEQVVNRIRKLDQLQEAGADPFDITSYSVTAHSADIIDSFDKMEGQVVRVAGRLMSKRGMGKVSFADLADRCGRIQIFTRVDVIGKDSYKEWRISTSAISSVLKGRLFGRTVVRYPFAPRLGSCSQRLFALCRKNSTDSEIQILAIASATSISSLIRTFGIRLRSAAGSSAAFASSWTLRTFWKSRRRFLT